MTKRKQEAAQGLQSIMFLHPFASVRPQTAEETQAVVEDGRWRRNRQWWRTGGGGGRVVVVEDREPFIPPFSSSWLKLY